MFKDSDCLTIEIALHELLNIVAEVFYTLHPRAGYVYIVDNETNYNYLDDTCANSLAQIEQVYYFRQFATQKKIASDKQGYP